MGKRKKTITTAAITALIIGIFVLCCFLYTKNREKYYADNPMYFPDMIYCSSACNALVFDYDARGYAATSIRISGSDISFVPWFSLEHYVEPLKIRVSEFEKYMLYDYLNYVLQIHKQHDSGNSYDYKDLYLSICAYDMNGSDRGRIAEDAKGTFKTNVFVLVLLTMIYARGLIPCLIVFYAFVVLLCKKAYNGIETGTKKHKYLSSDYVKFMLVSILIITAVNFVFLLPPVRMKFSASQISVREYGAYLNWSAGCIAAFLELIAIMLITRDGKTKTGIAYAIPTAIMLFVHLMLLHRPELELLSVIQKETIGKLHNEIIFFNEFWPFYPKVIYFTLFFALALPIYLISGVILEKRLDKGFCRAVSFSVSSALLVTMPSYLLMYCFRY